MLQLDQVLNSQAFKSILPTMDDMIKDIHPNPKVRMYYVAMRIMGLDEYHAKKFLNYEIQRRNNLANIKK